MSAKNQASAIEVATAEVTPIQSEERWMEYIGGFCTTPQKGIVHSETVKTHFFLPTFC